MRAFHGERKHTLILLLMKMRLLFDAEYTRKNGELSSTRDACFALKDSVMVGMPTLPPRGSMIAGRAGRRRVQRFRWSMERAKEKRRRQCVTTNPQPRLR